MNCASLSTFFSTNCNCNSDAALPQALTLLPIIGPVVQLFQELAILYSIKKNDGFYQIPKLIELIQLKNQYKICGIARCLISLAVVVTVAALGILSPAAALFAGCVYGMVLGLNAWAISVNEKAIKSLEEYKNQPFEHLAGRNGIPILIR